MDLCYDISSFSTDGTILHCAWARVNPNDVAGCYTFAPSATAGTPGSWTKFGDRTATNTPCVWLISGCTCSVKSAGKMMCSWLRVMGQCGSFFPKGQDRLISVSENLKFFDQYWPILFLRGNKPAIDYHPNVGLMMVAGEFCQTGAEWCGVGTSKTLLSTDGGLSFSELADFPDEVEATCGVFLNDTSFMVIGGRSLDNTVPYPNTWLYDVTADTWSSGK